MKVVKATKRLKIVEQLIIVVLFAVLIPFTISSFIINNINQQSVRAQLCNTAVIIANSVSDSVDVFQNSILNELEQISMTLNYFHTTSEKLQYLNQVKNSTKLYKDICIVNSIKEYDKIRKECAKNNEATFKTELKNGKLLVAIFEIEKLKTNMFTSIGADKRQVYILSSENELLTAYNYDKKVFQKGYKQLPKKLETDKAVIYGKKKNQPFVYLKKTNPNILIIVSTPREITRTYIEYSREIGRAHV